MRYALLLSALLLVNGLWAQDTQYLPSSTNGQIIHHQHYSLSWSEEHEQPEWVVYELTPREARGNIERTDNFRQDPHVSTGSASLADFRGSGYDRGHLAPAADMAFSHQAMSESFYLSNMTPQEASFNRGIWRQLESQVRSWARNNGPVYVITGGILDGSYRDIGPNDVTVPEAYYKIILDQDPPMKALAFMLENEKGSQSLPTYTVTIDAVEEQTGIDFFPEMPEKKEKKLEGSLNTEPWDFGTPATHYDRHTQSQQYYTDSDNKIDINRASRRQLKSLPGIGEVLSGRIIRARPFGSIHEVKDVKGIGPKTFDKIRWEISAR